MKLSFSGALEFFSLEAPLEGVLHDGIKSALELSCGEFLMGNLSKKEFIDMYYDSTSDYGFLMINNNSIKDNEDLDEIYGIIKTPENFA